MADDKKIDDRRSFEGPDESKYYIVPPNANDIREADWNYSRTYTRSLTEGITTSAEMMDILRRRGIVGPEFEQRAAELTTQLNEKIFDLLNPTQFLKSNPYSAGLKLRFKYNMFAVENLYTFECKSRKDVIH